MSANDYKWFKKDIYSNNCCKQHLVQIGQKQHKQTTVTSYYITLVFNLPCESKSAFTMYPNPDSLIEYIQNQSINQLMQLEYLCYLFRERAHDPRVKDISYKHCYVCKLTCSRESCLRDLRSSCSLCASVNWQLFQQLCRQLASCWQLCWRLYSTVGSDIHQWQQCIKLLMSFVFSYLLLYFIQCTTLETNNSSQVGTCSLCIYVSVKVTSNFHTHVQWNAQRNNNNYFSHADRSKFFTSSLTSDGQLTCLTLSWFLTVRLASLQRSL